MGYLVVRGVGADVQLPAVEYLRLASHAGVGIHGDGGRPSSQGAKSEGVWHIVMNKGNLSMEGTE